MHIKKQHVSQGISNSSCHLIVDVSETGLPEVAFPVEGESKIKIK